MKKECKIIESHKANYQKECKDKFKRKMKKYPNYQWKIRNFKTACI